MVPVKNKSQILGCVLYISATFILLIYAIIEFRISGNFLPTFNLRPVDRVFFLLASAILMHFGALALTKNCPTVTRRQVFRINLMTWLFLYFILLITLTLFDDYSYRDSLDKLDHYIARRYNFIPLHMIKNYLTKFHHGYISFEIFFYNIAGNLLALMPLSLLLPLLFKTQNHFPVFLLTILAITSLIEITQYLTVSGTCDIDDIILNTLGASIAYLILQIPPIKTKIQQFFFQSPTQLTTPTSKLAN